MLYQITAPPQAAPEKQADELSRLLKHSKTLTVQFVTVAGQYKPTRARLMVLHTPDRFAEQAARVLTVLSGREDATKQSDAIRMRPEWKQLALFLPTDPNAPALDGTLLDGWDSALLTVVYQPGRAIARLQCCAEDSERIAALSLPGWQIITKPNVLQLLSHAAGKPWQGVPSLVPVPGGRAVTPKQTVVVERNVQIPDDAPAPLAEEVSEALRGEQDGFILGVKPEGEAVRLARRAMTVAVVGSQDARQRALLALIRRGMDAGLGIVVAADRQLLPQEAMQGWQSRVRLLDVQNIPESAAIPWREIAPDLLAQAIGGTQSSLGALPARFSAALSTLGAGALRIPEVLGLAAAPGDNLRGVIGAGGMVVVPQDGDAASSLIARLLLAYLATPPVLGRGVLILADSVLVPPETLSQQAIQVVLGERSDALLRLITTDTGWKLSAPDGTTVAELLPDLTAQPLEGAGDVVDSILQDIATPPTDEETSVSQEVTAPDRLTVDEEEFATQQLAAPIVVTTDDEELLALEDADPPIIAFADDTEVSTPEEALDGWWNGGTRSDDLDETTEVLEGASAMVITDVPDAAAIIEVQAEVIEAAEPLDAALDALFAALMATEPVDAHEQAIREAIERADFAQAEATARAWSSETVQVQALPWVWQVVLTEDNTDRAVAAWRAIQQEPDDGHVSHLRAVLDVMNATEPAAWLSQVGDGEFRLESTEDEPEVLSITEWPNNDLETAEQPEANQDYGAFLIGTPLLPELYAEYDPPQLVTSPNEENDVSLIGTPLMSESHTEYDPPQLVASPNEENGASLIGMPLLPAETATTIRVPVFAPIEVPMTLPQTEQAALVSDEQIRDLWRRGETVPQLVARLVATGSTMAAARVHVRSLIRSVLVTPTDGATPQTNAGTELPQSPTPPQSAGTSPVPITPMPEEAFQIDDASIWQHWQNGSQIEAITIAMCGRRGGPRAEVARQHLYRVVIPLIAEDLDAYTLVARLVAGEIPTGEPLYTSFMQRLARSEHPPIGNLEHSLLRRLRSLYPAPQEA